MKKLFALVLFLSLFLALDAGAQVPISHWPIPTSGSTNLSTGDAVVGTRGGVSYKLLAGWGGTCAANTWASFINPQGIPTCTQPAFSSISGFLSLAQLAGTYTDGQILIGNTATGQLSGHMLTAGSNITITNAASSITIASTASGTVNAGVIHQAAYYAASGSAVSPAQLLLTTSGSNSALTNAYFDTAGTNNVLKINGTAISAVTGTGAAVLASSPTLVTPSIDIASGTALRFTTTSAASGNEVFSPAANQVAISTAGSTALLFTATQSIGIGTTAPAAKLEVNGTTKLDGTVQVAGDTTGAGTPLLGTNSPAITNTAPYTWLKFISSDGSTVYVPAYK